MKHLTILIELRPARMREGEGGLYGSCITDGQMVSRVFIDSRRPSRTRVNTFFHEIAHAYLHWKGNVHGARAEKVAEAVGRAAEKAYRGVMR